MEDDWKKAEETAKEDISSMVFNTFIWCQVGERPTWTVHQGAGW